MFSKEEKKFLKRNVEFFIDNLPFKTGGFTAKDIEIEFSSELNIKTLKLPDYVEEKDKILIKEAIQTALFNLFLNLEFYNPDDLDIRLSDFIKYIKKSRLK